MPRHRPDVENQVEAPHTKELEGDEARPHHRLHRLENTAPLYPSQEIPCRRMKRQGAEAKIYACIAENPDTIGENAR